MRLQQGDVVCRGADDARCQSERWRLGGVAGAEPCPEARPGEEGSGAQDGRAGEGGHPEAARQRPVLLQLTFRTSTRRSCNELKSTKKDQSIVSEGSLKTQSQLANVQSETEELRRHAARLKWQLCEAMNKRQEDSTKLQSIGELVNSVSVLHLEQLNAYAKEHGDIRDEALRRFFQEKRDQARKVISRLKTLVSDETVGSGAVDERDHHNQPAQQNGQSNLQQQQQRRRRLLAGSGSRILRKLVLHPYRHTCFGSTVDVATTVVASVRCVVLSLCACVSFEVASHLGVV